MGVLGKLANWFLPPMVSVMDEMEGQRHIRITTSEFYTVIQIDDVSFYFDRETGRYDGTATRFDAAS